MGHPILTTEDIQKRNAEIVAYANQHPNITNDALGLKYNLSAEAIRGIRLKDRRRVERNQRMAEKARAWGFIP
jgi:hypothetical protein